MHSSIRYNLHKLPSQLIDQNVGGSKLSIDMISDSEVLRFLVNE